VKIDRTVQVIGQFFFMYLIPLFITRFSHNSIFSKTKKELPLVALFGQEKRRVQEKCFSLQSGVKS
jgi:hypothetical protein